MRKKSILLFLIFVLVLTACGESEVQDKHITINYNDKKLDGVFTGKTKFNNPVEGIFKHEDDDYSIVLDGTWTDDEFEGKETVIINNYTLDINNNEYTGKYEGESHNLIPNGSGEFIASDEKLTYEGEFFDGEIGDKGKIKSLEYTFESIDKKEVSGIYDGDLAKGVPNGKGKFIGSLDFTYSYEGEWKDGKPSGEGYLIDEEYSTIDKDGEFELKNNGEKFIGRFEGTTIEGLPSGTGTYESENSQGMKWNYEGEFKEGKMHGKGKTEFHHDEEDKYEIANIGTFVDGIFTPNAKEVLDTIYTTRGSTVHLEYAGDSAKILEKYNDNFLDSSTKKIEVRDDFSYREFIKNPNKYEFGIYRINNLTVHQIFENESLYTRSGIVTEIIAEDDDYNLYWIFLYNSAEGVYEGSNINVVGLPVNNTSYENVMGGETNTVFVSAMKVELN